MALTSNARRLRSYLRRWPAKGELRETADPRASRRDVPGDGLLFLVAFRQQPLRGALQPQLLVRDQGRDRRVSGDEKGFGHAPMMNRRRIRNALVFSATLAAAPCAGAKEILLDCARTDQTVMVGVDTDKLFIELMWSEGVAEEYKHGDSYISGPDSFGEKEKVTYVVTIDKDLVTFGQDRTCLQSGTKKKCVDSQTRDTLDLAKAELKYDLGDEVAVFRCQPA